MKSARLVVLLALTTTLTLLSGPATAQTPPAKSTPATDGPTLPQALSSLVMITYACQAVSGPELYTQADDLARKVTLRMTGDQNITVQFMKMAEDHAKAACPNTTTCWHELLDEGETATPDNGKTVCQKYIGNAANMVANLVAATSGDPKPESGS